MVGDLAARRFPSYAVIGLDRDGNTWQDVVTDYTFPLRAEVARWWYTPALPPGKPWPSYPGPGGIDGPADQVPADH